MNVIKSYIVANAASSQAGGSGSVTSVGDLSPLFTTSNPTTTPTFTAVNQNANLVYAGPSTGIAAAPTFRAIVAADLGSGADGTKFLRDDMTWQAISAGGIGGSIASTQVAFGSGANTISGNANFTFDSTNLALTVNGIRLLKTSGLTYQGLALGNGAGYTTTFTTADGGNYAFGTDALSSMTDGTAFYESSYNSAFGHKAGDALTRGFSNSFFGFDAGKAITTGYRNSFFGASSGDGATTCNGNTGFGYLTLSAALTGEQNTAIGEQAGTNITAGNKNVVIGPTAGITSGSYNILIGSETMENLTTQGGNVAVGHWAGVYAKGATNTFVGFQSAGQALNLVTDMTGNTFVGQDTGNDATNYAYDLDYSTFIGAYAGLGSTTQCSYSTALGYKAKVYSNYSMVFGSEVNAERVNYGFGGESYAAGQGVAFFKNATTNPSGNPTNGFILYSDGGVAKVLNASGTAFTLGAAGWSLTGTSTLTGANIISGTSTNTVKFKFDNLAASGTEVFTVQNTQAAVNGTQQDIQIHLEGRGFATGVNNSQATIWRFRNLPIQAATNPTTTLQIGASINGGAYGTQFSLTSAGTLTVPDLTLSAGTLTLSSVRTIVFNGGTGTLALDGNSTVNFRSNWAGGTTTTGVYRFGQLSSYDNTSSTVAVIGLELGFAPTSGTGILNGFQVTGTVNMTGGANGAYSVFNITPTYTAAGGDVMGFYYNPTVTSISGVHYSFRATSGLMALPASTTGSASFRIVHGSAPSSPVDGDIWTTTTGLFVRINGSTVGPLS